MGIQDFGKSQKALEVRYQRETGQPLTKEVELEPRLRCDDFPPNQRYYTLIWQALELEKISESKAAELLNMTIEALRIERVQQKVYAIA
ncbi:MAG: hypothetical protein SAJ12_22375 [Jaaginema sp. PMC 1079.18]|nr:hypothetical protein [Jaaginema sp. PMC 1080.18]MEC4853736.1 hypothetical protein [Jaaginema sp. PMC 1079.18]MEC4866770.1 hypothetical protein [Jaaginema sp. PMC 1078.18]